MADPSDAAVDLVIIGSGAAGLTAAVTALAQGASVLVLESSDQIGGTTALSEGMIWAPNTPEARAIPDAPDADDETKAALAYLRATAGNHFDEARAAAYLHAVGPMLALVQQQAALGFALNRGSRDYVPDAPGATLGRRALNPLPVDARAMRRARFAQLRPPLGTMMLFGGMSIASRDALHFQNVARHPASALLVARRVAAYVRDRLSGWPRGTDLANGGAIVAALAQAVDRAGGDLRISATVQRLLVRGGAVQGVDLGGAQIRTRLGVILANGGLNTHAAARAALVGQAGHVALPPTTPGPHLDDLVAGLNIQADRSVSQPVLWAPASVVPASVHRAGGWPHFGDRAKPGVICVGPDGQRFANEAAVYHDFVPKLIEAYGDHPQGAHAWIVTDHVALRRYGLGPIGPFPVRLGPYLRAGYLLRGQTLAELAQHMTVDPARFVATITRFNDHATRGEDPDFGRGISVYDRGNGDASHGPNPALGPVTRAPFYAIRTHPGDIGSFVGLRTDARARVLAADGTPVPGLWAAGNAASPMTGGTYAAAGLTIGAAMTFGYIAALDAAGNARNG